jgi:transcriptional regulator with XRE-family HTH domain
MARPTPVIDRRKLRRLRQRLGWTQQDLAERSGVQRPTISKIETGNRQNLRTTTLQRLAQALGVTADDLLLAPPLHAVADRPPDYKTTLAAVVKLAEDLEQADLEDLLEYIEFLRAKRGRHQADLH